MKFLEKDLEDILWSSLSTKEGVETLKERGLDCAYHTPFIARQLRIGNYGICDMISLSHNGDSVNVTIYELKKDEINIDGIIQLSRYVTGCKRYLKSRFKGKHVYFTPIIIGRSINTNDWVYMFNVLHQSLGVYTYDYEIDGLSFEFHYMNFYLTEEGFEK